MYKTVHYDLLLFYASLYIHIYIILFICDFKIIERHDLQVSFVIKTFILYIAILKLFIYAILHIIHCILTLLILHSFKNMYHCQRH